MSHGGGHARDLYAQRLIELAREAGIASSRSRACRITLLALLMATIAVTYSSFGLNQLPLWTAVLPLPIAAFVASQAGRWRDRAVRVLTLTEYYTQGVARLERNWDVLDTGDEFIDVEHLYAIDLDLFGRGCLFQLLCSTRTQAGREVLAAWLTTPADLNEVIARRAACAELRARPDFRERLAAAGGTRASDCHPDTFRTWVARSLAHQTFAPWILPAAFVVRVREDRSIRRQSGARLRVTATPAEWRERAEGR